MIWPHLQQGQDDSDEDPGYREDDPQVAAGGRAQVGGGRRPRRLNTDARGGRRQLLDGQNTRGPVRASSAGIRVRAASSIRATATARPGPKVEPHGPALKR